MKKIYLLLLGWVLLSQWSCKKDEPVTFSTLSFASIKAKESSFSTDQIILSTADAELISAGSIILFYTAGGNYGKMLISNNGHVSPHALVFDMVLYNAQGAELFKKQGVSIATGYLADLDQGIQVSVDGSQSFYWTQPDISPENGAKFYVYLKK